MNYKHLKFRQESGGMRKKRWISLLLICTVLLSACGGKKDDSSTESDAKVSEIESSVVHENVSSDLFTDRDFETKYDESTSAKIILSGSSVYCDSDAVEVKGSRIMLKDEGTYMVSGSVDDGMIVVNADKTDKIQIVLDNAEINSETSAPIYILQADKVFLTMAEGSSNELSNGGSYEPIDENNIDSVIFSKEDITLNGKGTLTITSPAGHGIVSKDELAMTSGTYIIQSAGHGISGKDNVCIANTDLEITAGKDGIKAENEDDETLGFVYFQNGTFDIATEGDGISASGELVIQNGTFDIITGGGSENAAVKTSNDWGNFMGGHGMGGGRGGNRPGNPVENRPGNETEGMNGSSSVEDNEDSTSIKGIKAVADLTIYNGAFSIDSADDAVHSNSNVTIDGGTFSLATGDDGFHADDTLTVSGGSVDIMKSYEGLEGLHVLVAGGDISMTASDDGINAAGGADASGIGGIRGGDTFHGHGAGGPGMGGASNGSIVISGGTIHINASGDGIDANGSLEITGGTTVVSGPFQGDTATLDYDTSAIITGGTFIGTGAAGMAQTFSDSEQGVIAVNAGNQTEGTKIILEDKTGNIILNHEAELSFSVVILSSPDVKKGETYKITVGEISGEFAAS